MVVSLTCVLEGAVVEAGWLVKIWRLALVMGGLRMVFWLCVVVVVMGLGLSVSWTIVVLCLMLYGRYLTLMITVLDYCMLAAGRQGASPSLLGQGTAMQ